MASTSWTRDQYRDTYSPMDLSLPLHRSVEIAAEARAEAHWTACREAFRGDPGLTAWARLPDIVRSYHVAAHRGALLDLGRPETACWWARWLYAELGLALPVTAPGWVYNGNGEWVLFVGFDHEDRDTDAIVFLDSPIVGEEAGVLLGGYVHVPGIGSLRSMEFALPALALAARTVAAARPVFPTRAS